MCKVDGDTLIKLLEYYRDNDIPCQQLLQVGIKYILFFMKLIFKKNRENYNIYRSVLNDIGMPGIFLTQLFLILYETMWYIMVNIF